jgi:hypothetical protein
MSIEDSFKYKYHYIQDASYQKHLDEKHPKNVSNVIDTKRIFQSGSQRDDDSNKPLVNHLTAYTRLRFGYLLREGANKYGKNNWQKGQPTETALESLHRHLAKYEIGDRNEDHLSAIIFNVQLIMQNEEKEGIKIDEYYGNKENK